MLRPSRGVRAAAVALFGACAACSYGNYDGSYDGGPDSFLAQFEGGFVDAAVTQTFAPDQDGTLTSGDGVFTVHVPIGAYTTSFTLNITPHPFQGDGQTTAYEVVSLAGPPQKLVSVVYRIPNGVPTGNIALQQQNGSPVFYSVQQGPPAVASLDTRSFGTFRLTYSQGGVTLASNPATCLTQCCGPSASVAVINGMQACGCTTNDAVGASKCLETCPESLPQRQCAGSAPPKCGNQTCVNTPCCIQGPTNPICGQTCNGVAMQCTARSDCAANEVCCLQVNGGQSTAQCMQTCPPNAQVCAQEADCSNGGTCGPPGSGSCPFQTCGKIATGVCP